MATTIITKNGSGAPTAGQLSEGELAVDLTNKELYTKAGSTVIKIGGTGGGETGTFTDLTATSSFTSPGIDDNATSTAITIDSSENVGIGTSSPYAVNGKNLTINDALISRLVLENTGASGRDYYIGSEPTGGLNFYDIDAAAERMRINSSGNVGIGATTVDSALHIEKATPRVTLQIAGNSGYNTIESGGVNELIFGRSGTEQMRIDSSGNVGIGTTSPNNTLQVRGASTTGGPSSGNVARFEGPSGTNGLKIFVDDSANASGLQTIATDDLLLNPLGGNVGIGTASPVSNVLLHIAQTTAEGLPATFPVGGAMIQHNQSSAYGAGLYIIGGSAGYSSVLFGDKDSATQGEVKYSNSDNSLAFYANNAERMRIDSSGNLLVGTTSAGWSVAGSVNATGYATRSGQGGSFNGNGFNIAWTSGTPYLWIDSTNVGQISTVSDYRVKRNIETQTQEALSRISQLRPVTYQREDYKKIFKAEDEVLEGFIAHELQEIIPSAVAGQKDDPNQVQSLKLDALCSVMVKAIQEQQAMIEDLKAEVAALKGA